MCVLLVTDLRSPSLPFLPVVDVTEVLDATVAVLPNCWMLTGAPDVFITRLVFVMPVDGSSELGRWWMVELGEAKKFHI